MRDDGAGHGLFIDGEWSARADTFARENPARPSELVGRFARASAEDVQLACAAAARAASTWGRLPQIERGAVLRRAADLMVGRAESLATDITREEGKTLREARAEIGRGVEVLRYFAGAASQPIGDLYPSADSESMLYTVRQPVGVVGVITPWNFPVAIPLWKIAPALVYGNAVVWKPAEITSLSAVSLAEVLADAGLPPGVLNVVTGRGSVIGPALVRDPATARITFTGSVATGRALMAEAAAVGVHVQAEMGGKNPVVVAADADLELAAAKTVTGAMSSTGQKCSATSRAIVLRDVYDEYVERLVDGVSRLRVGDPMLATTDIGPLASQQQLRTVSDYLALARAERCTFASGGGALDVDGWFVEPTVLLDVDPGSSLARDEIFGPVLCVFSAESLDEALELANCLDVGLSASVFTRDLGTAMRFAHGLEAGMVHVNGETPGAEPHVPFGGMKTSATVTREQGRDAAQFFTQGKTVHLAGVTPP